MAAVYQKLGVKKGDCALVYIPMIPWLYAGMFAFQMLGGPGVFSSIHSHEPISSVTLPSSANPKSGCLAHVDLPWEMGNLLWKPFR